MSKIPATLWDLHPDMRMDILKRMIVTIKEPILRDYTQKKYAHVAGLGFFPLIWKNDLERLCDVYDCDFKFITDDNDELSEGAGGFHTERGKRPLIYINADYRKPGPPVTTHYMITTISHELGHAIQYKLYGHPAYHIPGYGRLLSAQWAFELEACRLSYYIYKAYFTEVISDIHPNRFRSYRSKADKLFLLESWGPSLKDDMGITGKRNKK